MSVNVNRSVSDVFYRYKMPRLQAKVEGKGNGIKTVIVNMAEVAKALSRPPTYPTKYFGCELGAQTQFDFKNERFIVNGSHDAIKLQDLLDGFIRKFVLCPECDNPETDLLVSAKRGTIHQSCKACGYHGLVVSNHKLITYILKNPPNLNPASQGSSLTEGKRTKRSKRSGPTNGDTSKGEDGAAGEDDVDAAGDVSSNNHDDNSSSPPSSNHHNNHNDGGKRGDDDDTEWAVDTSREAVRARMQDLTDGAKQLTLSEELQLPERQRMDLLYERCQRQLRATDGLTTAQAQKDLVAESVRLEMKSKMPLILAELLFDKDILTQAKKHRTLILRFTLNDNKAQKYLLGGIEQVVALHKDSLMAKVPVLLKLLYDLDILGEPSIMEWAEKVSKKYVAKEVAQEMHTRAAPFIKWLKEAEEEDDSEGDDDEESDVEIEYNDRAQVAPLKQVKTAPSATADKKKIEQEEEDFDIDAI